MKKIFTLIAAAVVSLSASAIDYKVGTKAIADGGTLLDNVFATITIANQPVAPAELKDESDNPAPATYAGETFTHYFNVRVDAAPNADAPTGTIYADGVAIVVAAKKNVDVTLYYRIGATKALSCYDQTTKSEEAVDQKTQQEAGDNLYCTGVYKFQEGHTYTIYAKGGTIQFHGLSTAEGTYVAPTNNYYANAAASKVGDFSTMTYGDGAMVQLVGNASKSYSSGSSITIDGKKYTSTKVSNGAQNKFVAPEGKKVYAVTIYSYVNVDAQARPAYWKEVNGVAYSLDGAEGTVQTTEMMNFKNGANPEYYTYVFAGGVSEFTFTNTGEQVCFVLDVNYDATPVEAVAAKAVVAPKAIKYVKDGKVVIVSENVTIDAAAAQQ